MGFLDVLRGKRQLRQPTEDRLFAMTTAVVSMQESGLEPTGTVAMVFQPLGTADFDQIVSDMVEVLNMTGEEAGTQIESRDDTFGYRWMVLTDPDFEDLVVGLNAVNGALHDGGYADRVLAAVFPFQDRRGRHVLFIYNVKRATYYPFVARRDADQSRDSEEELRLKARFERELPMEQDLGRWFPLWG